MKSKAENICENMATGAFIPTLPQFSHLGSKGNDQTPESFTSYPNTDSFCGFGQPT